MSNPSMMWDSLPAMVDVMRETVEKGGNVPHLLPGIRSMLTSLSAWDGDAVSPDLGSFMMPDKRVVVTISAGRVATFMEMLRGVMSSQMCASTDAMFTASTLASMIGGLLDEQQA